MFQNIRHYFNEASQYKRLLAREWTLLEQNQDRIVPTENLDAVLLVDDVQLGARLNEDSMITKVAEHEYFLAHFGVFGRYQANWRDLPEDVQATLAGVEGPQTREQIDRIYRDVRTIALADPLVYKREKLRLMGESEIDALMDWAASKTERELEAALMARTSERLAECDTGNITLPCVRLGDKFMVYAKILKDTDLEKARFWARWTGNGPKTLALLRAVNNLPDLTAYAMRTNGDGPKLGKRKKASKDFAPVYVPSFAR